MAKKKNIDEVSKSLSNLEKLAKSQLHFTPRDSDPQSWAGSDLVDVDSFDDDIESNGLDYVANGTKSAAVEKSQKGLDLSDAEQAIVKGQDPIPYIINKLEKGFKLTDIESYIVKSVEDSAKDDGDKDGDAEKAEAPGAAHDDDNAPDTLSAAKDEKDEYEAEVSKSLDQSVNSSRVMKSGIEMSPFLYEFANAFNEALKGVENRVAKSLRSLEKSLQTRDSEQAEFFKSLAEAVVGVGDLVKSQVEVEAAKPAIPARGPKSVMAKSVGGLAVNPDALQKSQILDTMVDMVKSQKLSTTDVIAFESTGTMAAHVQAAVSEYLSGKR